MGKAKKPVKPRVVKTRNSGSMTESAFWSFIRNTLRAKSRYWKPVLDCKRKSRRNYTGPNKRMKFEYQCNECKNWFPEKEINVDHINPVGTLRSCQDLPSFVERLFIEEEGLQVLCAKCHTEKTRIETLNRKPIQNE